MSQPETASVSAKVPGIASQNVREFLRYFGASLVALLCDAGSLALMTSVFHVPYLISAPIAFLFGLAIVYALSIYWVFERRDMQNPAAEFGIFLVIGVVGLGVNELVLWIFTGLFGVFYLVSKVASVVVVFTWNFFARKYTLFR